MDELAEETTEPTGGPTTEATERVDEAAATLRVIGTQIRTHRMQRGLTLESLGRSTGLSASMLSLVERGKASPSIGSLVAIALALRIQVADLLSPDESVDSDPVSRHADQATYWSAQGVRRRILQHDRLRGIELGINEYAPGTSSADARMRHEGYEFGFVLEGRLTVDIDDTTYSLDEGDLISYESSRLHRISNESERPARALWINMDLGAGPMQRSARPAHASRPLPTIGHPPDRSSSA